MLAVYCLVQGDHQPHRWWDG